MNILYVFIYMYLYVWVCVCVKLEELLEYCKCYVNVWFYYLRSNKVFWNGIYFIVWFVVGVVCNILWIFGSNEFFRVGYVRVYKR